MKKILSICLAALLLASVMPLAYAADIDYVDYTEGTAVVYAATTEEDYTLTVPALLTPGESGTVTLQGTWASNRVVFVTADKSVLLTNSIEDTDQKTLNVSFPGIDEYGNNTKSRTFTETVSVEEITGALFGTWSGRFAYYVEIINPGDLIENLQREFSFKYYSTMNLAVSDVNSGKIGTNADSDKDNAVAGVYIDNNGNVNVVLLKDTVLSEGIVTKKDMIINLGGCELSATDVIAIDQGSQNLVIDGRLPGSRISVTDTMSGNVDDAIPIQLGYVGGNLTVNGGTYISNAEKSNSACIDVRTGTASINDAEITATDTTGIARAIRVLSVASASVKNCECTVSSAAGQAVGIFAQGDASIEGSDIAATGSIKAHGVEIASDTTVTDSNISVNRETATGDTFGIYVRNGDKAVGNATVTNSNITVSGGKKAVGIEIVNTGTTATVENSNITALRAATTTYGIEVNADTIATVTESTVRSYADYLSSAGIYNAGTLTVGGGYVTGTHSGIQNYGSLNVDGGSYEGYGYGGFYFANVGEPAYVKKATTSQCAMPDGYAAGQTQASGLYIGGNSGINVYMDSCDIYGHKQPIVLNGANGEQNNALYISNSTINTDYTGNSIRNDNETLKVFLGAGNYFDATGAKTPGAIISTGETYIQ